VTHDSAMEVTRWKNLQLTGAVKQFFPLSDDWSLLWGLSGEAGSDPSAPLDPDRRAQIGGTDLYLKYRPLADGRHTIVSLQAEWFYRRRDGTGEPLHDTGGFAALFWRFAQRWATAARWELGTPTRNGAGTITPAPCPTADCVDGAFTADLQRISANITFWPTEFSRLRLQGATTLPGGGGDPQWSVLTAFEFAVGAHGAHAF
ncbi:MAG TPA: hypothetical protein VFH68_23970, partial [Polyangia bacterium]|nr:hypothetical protein [Polyangia bacterium]